MSPRPAYLASLVAAGPSAHEATSFTVYATLPLSGLSGFRRGFGIHDDLPRDGVVWEPPVLLATARWPLAHETDEAVIAEAVLDVLDGMAASGRLAATPDLLARLETLRTRIRAAAPAEREPA